MEQDRGQKSGREELEDTVQEQVTPKEDEKSKLSEEIKERREEITKKEEEIRMLQEDIRGVEKDIASDSGPLGRQLLESKLQFLWQQISSRDQQISSLHQQISSRDQQIIILRQEISSLWSMLKAPASAEIEKGLTSEPILTAVEKLHRELKGVSELVRESVSRTRAASTINADDLEVIRRSFDISVLPEEEVVSLNALLGAETEGGESFWDDAAYEVQLKEEYTQQFKRMIKSRDVIWSDANGTTLRDRFSNVNFAVSAKNDLILFLKRFRSLITSGAILGVEIKKKLSWRGLRQAEVEFYVWSNHSMFPFVQLITDMERGGVAIYSKDGRDVRLRTLGSMKDVRDFVSGMVKSLPPDAGEDDSQDGFINPETFLSPTRKRFKSGFRAGLGAEAGGSSVGQQMAFRRMVAAYNNNLDDVANLRDLDCFGIGEVY